MDEITPEATPARVAMSDERIEEFRMRAQDSRELLVTAEDGFGVVDLGFEEVDELLDEIECQRAVIAAREATIRDLLPMAEAWYHHECEYGGYDPINGDWATEQHQRDERAISRAKALAGEAVPE